MALDFQQMQSGLEVAALAKWDATDDTEVVMRGTHNGERYEARVSNVDCEYIMPESNGTIRIVINLESIDAGRPARRDLSLVQP